MLVVDVGEMGVAVFEHFVAVPVAVGFSGRIRRGMLVLMMFVVDVEMLVFQDLMPVHVIVLFRQMQQDANGHEPGSYPKRRIGWLPRQGEGEGASQKWRCGKISSGSSRPKMSERQNETDQAQTITEKPEHTPCRNRRPVRPVGREQKREPHVCASGKNAFDGGNLDRIGC